MYIYERKEWPKFIWDESIVSVRLASARMKQGLLLGQMKMIGFDVKAAASLQMVTEDVLKSSAIEGERLDRESVRSSVARRLGVDVGGATPQDRRVEGVVAMMLDATQNFSEPLTQQRLLGWQSALFPSGPAGREKIHFEAPRAARLMSEMSVFLKWFNEDTKSDLVLKAAIAHLWFVTIHPFSDGNGRIARALTDLLLARSENNAQRFYSLSSQVQAERNAYYDSLEETQKGDLDITAWLLWFLKCFERSIERATRELAKVLKNSNFWTDKKSVSLNERQRKILNKLLTGFEGKLTSIKYSKLAKCSQDSANRDINDLIEKKILKRDEAGGRSTSYSLV